MYCIGIDAHKSNASITVMDDIGNIVEKLKVPNSIEVWNNFSAKYLSDKPKIAIESSTAGKYLAKLLRDFGFEIHLANPKELKIIFKSNKKTDMRDAIGLAKLLRLGELPESYLPSEDIDSIRTLVRYRKSLGKELIIIKNKIHALLTINGIIIKGTDIFGKRGLRTILEHLEKLSEIERIVLDDLLSRLNDITKRIEEIENNLARIGKEIESVKLLMSFPGIDFYTAIGIYAEIGEITRFPDKDHFASYTGLVPKVDQSGERDVHGKITKQGPSLLRFFLVNSAHTLIKLSLTFKKIYMRLVRRLGKNKATIAVARRLALKIYAVLTTKKPYEEGFELLYERKLKKLELRAQKANPILEKSKTESLIMALEIHSMLKEPFS